MTDNQAVNSGSRRRGKQEHRPLPPKLTAPALKNLYDRERLYARLDKQWDEHRAIWVSAPGGAGKTSLALGYLASREIPSIWYQVDDGDGDVASFLYYLGKAVSGRFPKFRAPMPVLTAEYVGDVTTFVRNFFREMYRRLPAGYALVFDNYEDAAEQSVLIPAIQMAINEAPEGVNLLILSRVGPPPELLTFAMKGMLGRMDWLDLQLTVEETVGLAATRLPETAVDLSALNALHSAVGGWAAGVVLLAEQTREFGTHGGSVTVSGQKVIFDYFASELFAHADPGLQRFLARTALAPKATPAVAVAVTENAEAGAILDDLARRNFFTVRRQGAQEDYFEYHPLFREFLATQAERLFEEEELDLTRRTAARALAEVGEADAAVELYLKASAWDEAASLLLAGANGMQAQGRGQVVAAWIDRLPESYRAEHPWTLFWRGMCRLAYEPVQATESLMQAYHGFNRQGDVVGRYQSWCAIVEAVVMGWGNFTPLDPWIEESSELRKTPPPDEETAGRFACGMFVALMNRRPERSEIAPWEGKAWDVVLHGKDLNTRVFVGHNLVVYYSWMLGEFARAKAVVDLLRPLVEHAGCPLLRTGFAAMTGGYLWITGQAETCIEEVRKGFATADASGVHVWDAVMCTQMLMALIPLGRESEAAEYLGRMERLLPTAKPLERALHHHFTGWLHFRRGEIDDACLHLGASAEMASAAGAVFPHAVAVEDYGIALCYAGKRDQAKALIATAMAIGERIQSATLRFGVYRAEAEMHLLAGEEGACVESLRRALAVGRAYGIRGRTLAVNGIMSRLYGLALRYGIEVQYVASMVRQLRLPPPEADVPKAWPWEAKVFALGRLVLNREGASVLEPGTHSTKPVALLLALAIARGKGLSEARLIEMLWPDSRCTGRQTLRVTLHRLRALVGDDVVVSRDGRLVLDRTRCWADIWELDRLLQEVRDVGTRPVQKDVVVGLAEELKTVYQGRLFEDESHEFLTLEGERLHDLAIQGCAIIATQLQAVGAYEELLALLSWGLELEPTAEGLYQIEMAAYLALGQSAAGLAAYERCRRMLATRLGVRPSTQTEGLAESLRSLVPRIIGA